ncbi:hypothetical protein [Pontibacillus marinus]|uniref:Uncharacterized protein n=1 Tax=Pontibacillus marinus BH030004 = DSM 16465 TaxID=1385511 RepID=A0A0A5I2P6_9BACI|nr:hypothetical protein [Pontibacillus marinus]KGX90122.1 hypothetical protein N783_01130 [Pontibacillus marinus BH030004 = DSM 16465]
MIIIRKFITIILATLISMTLLMLVLFDESLDLDFVYTVLFTSYMFSPFILLYGVPVTFFSDYVTKQFSGVKRAFLAMIFHLFFGGIFPVLLGLIQDLSKTEANEVFIGAITFSFFFWAFDEVIRRVLSTFHYY